MIEITSLKEPLVETCSELLPQLGINHKFICELPESTLNSGEPINVVVGLSNGLDGNIVLGMTHEATLHIVSGMMGGAEINALDNMGRSALSEFANMLCGSTVIKIQSISKTANNIDISPPTLVTGDDISLTISKTPAKKLFFKIGNTKFNIGYSIQ